MRRAVLVVTLAAGAGPAGADGDKAARVAEMTFAWRFTSPDFLDVYDMVRSGNEIAALVRVANHTELFFLDDAGKELRRTKLLKQGQNSLMDLAVAADGTLLLAGQCKGKAKKTRTNSGGYAACFVRVSPAGKELGTVVVPGTNIEKLTVATTGALIVISDPAVASDLDESRCVYRLSAAGKVESQRCTDKLPGMHDVIVLADGSTIAAGTATYDPSLGAVERVDAAGKLVWHTALPWSDKEAAAVEKLIEPDENNAVVRDTYTAGLIADGSEVVVFGSVGSAREDRSLPGVWRVNIDTGALLGPAIVPPLTEVWRRGSPVRWRPSMFTEALTRTTDGYVLATRFAIDDASHFAISRITTSGATRTAAFTRGHFEPSLIVGTDVIIGGRARDGGVIAKTTLP